jgi:hypothetical protein
MRAAARAGQFGPLLAVLLVLLGVSAVVAPGTGDGYAGLHRVSVAGESVSPAPSMHDDLQDRLRLSAGTLRAPVTALPETWWATCPRAAGECAMQGRLPIGEVDSTAMAAATPTPQSSRAPPFA